MAIIYVGTNATAQLREGVDHEIVIDETGLSTATLTYWCIYDYAVELVRRLTTHPDFPWLRRKKATIKRSEANIADVTVEYAGIDPDGDSSRGESNREIVTYELENVLDTEPIETHPEFRTFAGKWNDPATWVNGATFDPRGQFTGFTPTLPDGSANPKGGLRSFLSPGMVYTRTRTIPRADTLRGLSIDDAGRISVPPSSILLPPAPVPLPGYPTRSWLHMGMKANRVGDGLVIVEKWRLSGLSGWDPDIYHNA